MSVRKLLAALFAFIPLAANGAAVTHGVATAENATTPNTSGAFTPASNDLLVVGACVRNSTDAAPTLTSSVGGDTYTLVAASPTLFNTSANKLYVFVADQLATASSQTLTFNTPNDSGVATVIMVARVSGMSRTGTDAILQTSTPDENNASGQTPTAPFGSNVDTNNVTLGFLCNNSNPATVTNPTNWTEQADVGSAAPLGGEYVSRNSGFASTTITWGSTFGSAGGAVAVELDTSSAGVAVNFTSGPTVAAAANGYTISGTLNGSGFGTLTAYAVGVAPGDGTPTCTQIKAGQNDGGTAAILSANEAWTTDVGDSFSLATASKPASLDVHVCASDGTNDTSVTSAADQLRSARSGYALVTIASVSATGVCDHDSYFNPDCAIGDVFEYETATNENATCAVSIDTAGDVTLTPNSAGDCDGRRTFEISYEDVSSATDGLFTAPTVGNFSTDDTAYVNNTAPVCDINPDDDLIALEEDAAMTSVDLSLLGACTDDDGDSLTYSISSGTLPNGTSLGGTGNKDWSGTPDTEDEVGAALTVTVTDTPGDTTTFQFTAFVINTWTVPDLSGLDTTDAEAAIVAAAPWRENDIGFSVSGFTCDAGAENLVVSQDPTASTEAGATDPISASLSILCPSSSYTGERKVVYELSDVTGMTQWVDYVPVVVEIGCNAGTYDEDGCWAVTALSSTTGKTAWVDYIPVYQVPETVNRWRYENNGFIPVDTLTP